MKDTSKYFKDKERLLSLKTPSLIITTILSPFRIIKIRLQTQNEMLKSETLKEKYSGIFNCARKLSLEKRGFFKGNFTFYLKYLTTSYLNFEIYHFLTKKSNSEIKNKKKILKYFLIGAFTGILSASITYPLSYISLRLSNNINSEKFNNEKQFRGIYSVCRKTMNKNGIEGFFRGFWTLFIESGIYRGIYFGLFGLFEKIEI